MPGEPEKEWHWRCECGATFTELGMDEPGDDSGYRALIAHRKEHEGEEGHKILGLWEGEEQRSSATLWSVAARECGFPATPSGSSARVRRHRERQRLRQAGLPEDEVQARVPDLRTVNPNGHGGRPAFSADWIPVAAKLPSYLLQVFKEFQTLWPDRYPDDSPETLGLWIDDNVRGFTVTYAGTFMWGRIFAQAQRLVNTEILGGLHQLVESGELDRRQAGAIMERLAAAGVLSRELGGMSNGKE